MPQQLVLAFRQLKGRAVGNGISATSDAIFVGKREQPVQFPFRLRSGSNALNLLASGTEFVLPFLASKSVLQAPLHQSRSKLSISPPAQMSLSYGSNREPAGAARHWQIG